MGKSRLKPGDFGVFVYRDPRREMPAPCVDCPFVLEAAGRPFLPPERMEGIKFAVTMGQPFWCHKTVHSAATRFEEDPDGFEKPPSWQAHYRVCAGAIRWAEAFKIEREGKQS